MSFPFLRATCRVWPPRSFRGPLLSPHLKPRVPPSVPPPPHALAVDIANVGRTWPGGCTIKNGTAWFGTLLPPQVIELMAEFNARPIIFPLSNPTPLSECTFEQAFT